MAVLQLATYFLNLTMAPKSQKLIITDNQAQLFIQDYRAGHPISAIAQKHSVPASRVYTVFQKNGISLKDKGSALVGNKELIVQAYKAGQSLAEIAKVHDLTRQRVHQILLSLGVSKEDKGSALREKFGTAIATDYRLGKTKAELVAKYGLSREVITEMLIDLGVEPRPKLRARNEHAVAMISAFQAGKTMEEIGKDYNLTRQRVQQILKAYGISRTDGGNSAKHEKRVAETEQTRAKRIMKSWGLTLEEYAAHTNVYGTSGQPDSPMARYANQRMSCKRQGIEWKFTFKTWWAMWEASGKWDLRGKGQYGLGRRGDASTPMSPETCCVATVSNIVKDKSFVRSVAKKQRKGDSISHG